MTLSGQTKKPQPQKAVSKPEVDIKPPVKEEPKTKLDLLIEQLKEEKPQTYELYRNAIKAKKRVSIYPDLSVRIG
jgi:hypothetical protein